jgi:hypothetical protein
MAKRSNRITQSEAQVLMRAAANERVSLRLEIHSDGTLIAMTTVPKLQSSCEATDETPDELRKLI